MSTTVETFADSDGLVSAAGERLISVVDAAVAARGRALIVLTGGGNGNRLLRYLGAQAERIDWASVHLFWGDERYVTEDDDERNDKQAREALLDHVDIPARNVHAMPAVTASSAATWPPPRWPTSNSWPQTPIRVIPHRISTFICSASSPRSPDPLPRPCMQ